jgi:hypothetical protein
MLRLLIIDLLSTGVIDGLRSASFEAGRPVGLLLLAQMSSQGNLLTPEYAEQTVMMAQQNNDVVFGTIRAGCGEGARIIDVV